MSLADDLKLERDKINQCRVCVWLETQESEDRLAFNDWIKDGMSRTPLLRICQTNGLAAKGTALRNHINECMAKDSSCR